MAYVREKKIAGQSYYYLVEGKRVDGKVKQKVVRYLGKHDSIEDARAAAANQYVPKDENKKRYWITFPYRLGYPNSKPAFPVFLSKEPAENYGGPGHAPGESEVVEPEVLGLDGPELAAGLRGARLGANHIMIWGADHSRYDCSEPEEILSRRAFMKRLESAAN